MTAPAGGVWLPGPTGTPGHLWVADALRGFCRVTAGTFTNCNFAAKVPGQPSYDPTTSSVYVPDNSATSLGVVRLHFNQATETIDSATQLRPTDGLGLSRPDASAVDPLTGSLYVGFKKSASIVRITNPSLGVGDPVSAVGSSSDGRLTNALAFLEVGTAPELVEADSRGLSVLLNPASCNGICPTRVLPTAAVGLTSALSVVSDNVSVLYAGDATSVWRFDASAIPSTTNPGVYASGFSFVSGLTLDPLGTVYAGEDPSQGLVPLSGQVWSIAAQAPAVAAATVPGAPTIGAATAGNAQATVTWTPPVFDGGSAITSYTVTSSPAGATAVVAAPATSTTLTGLTNGTAYSFTVTASNAVGSSVASAASNSVTPVAPITSPGAPTAVTAAAGDTQATVSWTAPASNGGSPITSYTLSSSPAGATATITVAAPAASVTVTGLTNGTAYTFSVVATNAVGSSPASAASNSVTPGPATVVVSLAGPSVAIVQNPQNPSGSSTATFAFSATTSPVSFQCSLVAAGAPAAFTACNSPQTYTALVDGSYTFSVTATDSAGNSAAPASYAFTVQTLTVPTTTAPSASVAAPANLTLAGIPVTIAWSASACTTGVSGCNIAGYQLQESINGGVFADVALVSPTATSVGRVLKPSLVNLSFITTYQYQVRATNLQGQVSAFAIAPKFIVPLIDDTVATTFVGPWQGLTLLGAIFNGVHSSSTAGAWAGPQNAFAGTGAALVSTVGPDRGQALVSVDGQGVGSIDLYAPTQQAARIVWSTSGLSPVSTHTLTVTTLGSHNAASSGARVDVDAFVTIK